MPIHVILSSPFAKSFFQPLLDQLGDCRLRRECPKLSDESWLLLGVRRALEAHRSGRAFLQHLTAAGEDAPDYGHFFETLKSTRRLALTREISRRLANSVPASADAPFERFKELAGFDLYAGDGHFQGAAAHDPRDPVDGAKEATGHLFCLNLRTQALQHLTVADQVDRKKEHDMRALKRLDTNVLRQGAALGRKVLYVWDRAGIDFRRWQQWKQSAGIYFLSREKDNMRLEVIGENQFDRAAPCNQGVLGDELVATSQGVAVRRVRYHCPLRDETFHFLTSEYTIAPGLIAYLYRLRWEIEKTFDELKNQFCETQAWATSATAKTMQAHFLCMAHNLLLLCDLELARTHGLRNEAEVKRRAERLKKERVRLAAQGRTIPWLLETFQRLTQRSIKFLRWLRVQLFSRAPAELPIAVLRQFYARL